MHYISLITDYDGTLATYGKVSDDTIAALERLLESGRKIVLVTGRELGDLLSVFPRVDLFEWVVAENGALVYHPTSKTETVIAQAPPENFVKTLQDVNVTPLSIGRVIVSSWHPNETAILDVIRELGLEMQVIFNKGAVMVLPSGVNKASGLMAVLEEMKLSPHNIVGIGDGENDLSLLNACQCSYAVANSVQALKDQADFVTEGNNGAGVTELIDTLVNTDMEEVDRKLKRRHISIGTREDGSEVEIAPSRMTLLLAGSSGGGKSTAATAMLERLTEQGYQLCVIDPEGDYTTFEDAVVIGDNSRVPSTSEVIQLLETPSQSVIVNLLGLSMEERPAFFSNLLSSLQELRSATGRPHWTLVDEAHHVLPASRGDATGRTLPQDLQGTAFITVDPKQVAASVLAKIDTLIAVGDAAESVINGFCEATQSTRPAVQSSLALKPGEVIVWDRTHDQPPFRLQVPKTSTTRKRHDRKYAGRPLKMRA